MCIGNRRFCIVLDRNRGNVDKIAIVCGGRWVFPWRKDPWKEGKNRATTRALSRDYIR